MGVAHASIRLLFFYNGRGFLYPVCVRYLEAKLSHVWSPNLVRCPGIKKHPHLGDWFSVTAILISIRNMELVRCRAVVSFSEGPLSEARMFSCAKPQFCACVLIFLVIMF